MLAREVPVLYRPERVIALDAMPEAGVEASMEAGDEYNNDPDRESGLVASTE